MRKPRFVRNILQRWNSHPEIADTNGIDNIYCTKEWSALLTGKDAMKGMGMDNMTKDRNVNILHTISRLLSSLGFFFGFFFIYFIVPNDYVQVLQVIAGNKRNPASI